MTIHKNGLVEYEIGEKFYYKGMIYRTVREICFGINCCGQCQLPTCGSKIACTSAEREDGVGVEFVRVNE